VTNHPSYHTIHYTISHTMTTYSSVLFLGATGYIGGTVLQSILASSTPPSTITAVVRNEKKAEALNSLSTPSGTTLKAVMGDLSKADQLIELAKEHDIVINCANADSEEGIKALIEGMKQRRDKTGHRPLLIQTSGTGVLVDDAQGRYPSDRIYTDLNPTPATAKTPELVSFSKIPETNPHRPVDLEIIKADASGILKSYIILPSTIWGAGKGELYEKDIANSYSDQMPMLIRAALDRGQAGVFGKGSNIWPHVNIGDLGNLYGLVYTRAQKGDIGHGTAGYYLGIAGEYTHLSAANTIGTALANNKFAESGQSTSFTPEEIQKYYSGSTFQGSNARGVADRSKSIGWRPKRDINDFYSHLKEEVVRIEKRFGRKWEGGNQSAAWQK